MGKEAPVPAANKIQHNPRAARLGANISARPTSPHSCVLRHVRIANSSASRPLVQMQRTEKKTKQTRPTRSIEAGSSNKQRASAWKDSSIFIDTHSRSGSRHSTVTPVATGDRKATEPVVAWDFHIMQEINFNNHGWKSMTNRGNVAAA
ncbi:hypothetical protein Nepgr_023938 [Nepenthes gracilis]|uniref:Uncharacterized protein n=1 Tax=Nepenthes gracilis TaxID=150966 RepID=A0AAD3XZK0_NEPGR|nr:hypothetical protein Nepgr_023938 [Nepenthes gracilis]